MLHDIAPVLILSLDSKEHQQVSNTNLSLRGKRKLLGIAFIDMPLLLALVLFLGCQRYEGDPTTVASALLTLASAEMDFQDNDRDGDNVKNLWVKDIAGLYEIETRDGPLRLIDIYVAQADRTSGKGSYASVPNEKPYAGYYFAVLKSYRESGKSIVYDDGSGRNLSRFGLVAFPADYSNSSKLTFIINERNTIFQKDSGPEPPEEYPENPTNEGWKVYR